MPLWVHAELEKLIFPFFWKGKRDLLARVVVSQPPTAGAFSVVDLLPCSFSGYGPMPPPRLARWLCFLTGFLINFVPLLTLSWPTRPLFILAFCPPSIVPCCLSLREVGGSYSQRCSSFVVASLSPYLCCLVAKASAKHVYQFLLCESRSPLHCV